ncbi:MAG: glutamate 5-kinase [Alphaproteobacteria bacterium]|nr:glutamate 5-kinase [Alphaproteobacteria bacterium]
MNNTAITSILPDAQRIVIKTGSALVTHEATCQPRSEWMASLAEDIAALKKSGKQVILVSSGAVSLGRNLLGLDTKTLLSLDEKQAAAACGQVALMDAWRTSFAAHHLTVAQLLLTLDTSEFRRHYLNARNTLDTLLTLGAIPIVNENDTVATAELKIGDNDRLAARVAEMASADALLILSDIDGFYTADPRKQTDAAYLHHVPELTSEIEAMASNSSSTHGTGGMITKLQAVKIAHGAGCHTWIGAGRPLHPIKQLQSQGGGTWFTATATPKSARKRWISGTVKPTGSIIIDTGAQRALTQGNSLLAAGICGIDGQFDRGETVYIRTADGTAIGKGLIAYNSHETRLIMGKKSDVFESLLGYKGKNTLIHRDDMVLDHN